MKKILFIFSLLADLLTTAQNPLNYLASTKGGSCYEVCYHNNYLYAGGANSLIVYPLNGPNNSPGIATDTIRFISNIDYMTVRNNFLYVCANHAGLWKYDISNPAQPSFKAHYAPTSINESIYDMAFYGDSIYVAAKTKVNLIKDNGTSFSFLATVATYTSSGNTTRIRGVDIKDSLLAYTAAYSSGNSQDGVYIYNIKTSTPLSFYHDTQGDPQDVYFGQNTKLLHVMGGTLTSSSAFDGQYYALDYTTPSNPSLVFSQTINGLALLGSISMPMNCCIVNDTLYISTQGGGPIGYSSGPFSGQIYVFKATSPAISLLTDIYAGLYHFDCDIDPATKKMYIASEWYGVLTMDITNIYNEAQVKRTNTGGWCHGSAQAKNKLIEASEGYGMRLYDVSNMQKPTLLADDTTRGFSRAIAISDSADYAYGWFLTGKTFRVRDANNNLAFIKDTSADPNVALPTDFKKSRYKNGRVAVIEEFGLLNASHSILLMDVSNPLQSHLLAARRKDNVEDILFHPSGVLMACANDSILVLDQNNLSLKTSITPPLGALQPYKAFALSGDTLYVFYQGVGEGIAKYYYDAGLQTLAYLNAGVYNMNGSDRIFMAATGGNLYIASSLDSLKAITKTIPYTVIAKYDHGADFVFDKLWGNTDLYYNNGYLFLNEYQGQTSIFGPANNSTNIESTSVPKNTLLVYPNPANGCFTIQTGTKKEGVVRIYDAQGKLVYMTDVTDEELALRTNDFQRGLYFISMICNGKEASTKLVIEH